MINIFDLNAIVILPFLSAFLVALLLTPVAIFFIKKAGLVDDPNLHKHPGIIHTKPIPRAGGIPLFLATLIPALFFLPINQITISVFFAALLALVIGVIDDK